MTLLKAIKESPCLFSISEFSSIVTAESAVKPWSLNGSKVICRPFTNKLAGTSSPFCSSLILSPYTTVASLSGSVKRILTLEKSRNGSKRSEERRVGKECRAERSTEQRKERV